MTHRELPPNIRPLFEQGKHLPEVVHKPQEVEDRNGEAKRVAKRIAGLVEEHRQSAISLDIELGAEDLRHVIHALREHAQGGAGLPVAGARDAIHAHVLDRLFEELVEEPSNILFTTVTGPDTTRYEAMSAAFWLECLKCLEENYCP